MWSIVEGSDNFDFDFQADDFDVDKLEWVEDSKGVHIVAYDDKRVRPEVDYRADDYDDSEWGDSVEDYCYCYVSTGEKWLKLCWKEEARDWGMESAVNLLCVAAQEKIGSFTDLATALKENIVI